MKKLILSVSVLSMACMATPGLTATFYTDQASFLGALGTTTTIDFETQTAGDTFSSGDSIDGATFTFPMVDSLIVDNFFSTTSGSNYLGVDDGSFSFLSGDEFTVSFSNTLDAIGMYVIGAPGANLLGDFMLTTSNGDTAINSGTPDQFLADGDAFFIGLIADNAGEYFNNFTLSSLDFGFQFNIDDISYSSADISPIPVPAAVWLFGSALIGLVGIGRKKQHTL